MTGLRIQSKKRVGFFVVLLFLAVSVFYFFSPQFSARAVFSGGVTFTQLTTHPSASITNANKSIWDIAFDGNNLIAGYGDWTTNSDSFGAPGERVGIEPYDTAANSWLPKTPLVNGEAITNFSTINNHLYTTNTDASTHGTSGFASNRTGTWVYSQPATLVNSIHLFDITSRNDTDTDLWAVGSSTDPIGTPTSNDQAVVWHSIDGGATWSVVQTDADTPADGFNRYYWVAALNGSIYVEADGISSGAPLRKFDGTSWSTVNLPDKLCNASANAVEVFAGHIVCGSGAGAGISMFDGTTVTRKYFTESYNGLNVSDSLKDFYIDGSTLYVITNLGGIYKTNDLTTWTKLGVDSNPTSSTAIGVHGDYVYLGKSDGTIWRSDLTLSSTPGYTALPSINNISPRVLTANSGMASITVNCSDVSEDAIVTLGGIVIERPSPSMPICVTTGDVTFLVDTSQYNLGDIVDLQITNPNGNSATWTDAVKFATDVQDPTISKVEVINGEAGQKILQVTGQGFYGDVDPNLVYYLGIFNRLVAFNGQSLPFCATEDEATIYESSGIDSQYYSTTAPCYRFMTFSPTDGIGMQMTDTMFEIVLPAGTDVSAGTVQFLGGAYLIFNIGASTVFNFGTGNPTNPSGPNTPQAPNTGVALLPWSFMSGVIIIVAIGAVLGVYGLLLRRFRRNR